MLGRVFKAYDIRGTYPDPLNEAMAWQIGYGISRFLREEAHAAGDTSPMMRNIVVGRDMRRSSPALAQALVQGILDQGGDVIDVGMVDTPFVYFAINHLDCAGGVMVTASHNPPNYNGFKVSRRGARPVGEATGLSEIRKRAAMADRATIVPAHGHLERRDLWDAYRQHVRSFLSTGGARLKVVVDASNGMAASAVPRIFGKRGGDVPGLTIHELNFDNTRGEFAHEPNPLLPAALHQTQHAVKSEHADLGLCFDGDADRLVAVDERGRPVGCDLLTALLARYFLARHKGAAIVYDLRSTRALDEEIRDAGGIPVRSRVGHVFMKQAMAEHNAIFGGELSGHFYFRDNFNADSGVIAMAVVLSMLGRSSRSLSEMLRPLARYHQSGEINFTIEDKDAALANLKRLYGPGTATNASVDELDGVTLDAFRSAGWWANVRKSNTEPLLRLNLEARDARTLSRMLAEIAPHLGTRVDH